MRLMESPGKYLKAERESQNLSLKEVSESTKIREPLLKAIEEDQYDLISSPVYVKGFLDGYARFLGLDPNNIILQYQKHYENKTPLKGPVVKQQKNSPSLKWWVTFAKKKVTHWHLIIAIIVTVILIGMVTYGISLKYRHGSHPLSQKEGSTVTPEPSVPSPPPVQEEANTQTANPPEKVETAQPMNPQKNLGTKTRHKRPMKKE